MFLSRKTNAKENVTLVGLKHHRWRPGQRISLEQDVPDDVILVIIEFLSTLDNLKFCLVSKRMHYLSLSSLYKCIQLRSNEQCRSIMRDFNGNPHVTTIRSLVAHPNRGSDWAGVGSDKPLKEPEFVVFFKQIASAGQLSRLHTFKWEGLEAPEDELWLILRTCCPSLRNISTTVGLKTHDIQNESHLFSFSDLLSFSLTTQKSVKWSPFFQGKELPKRLWQMLLVNSPNMTELTLEGTCQTTQLWNIRKVLSGRWAQLRYFSIGSLSSRELPEDDQAMVDFISAHPTLENIHFQSGLYYSRTSMFYLPSLPLLRSFTGRIQQLKLAPELPSLQYLYFLDWFSPSARFAEILQSVPTVTSLSISMNPLELIERKTCLGLYERVITACPHLTHLEVSATGPIILKDFSFALRLSPKLQSFMITRTHRIKDKDMATSAKRIANENPTLQWFTIRDVTTWDHHDQLDSKYRFRQIGTYHILESDVDGAPPSLKIEETSVNQFGRRSTRCSFCVLYPQPRKASK